jgi:hypothetical protein
LRRWAPLAWRSHWGCWRRLRCRPRSGCRGALGAVTVDNLLVPQNATCNLNGTRVQGTAQVQRNATLNANGIRVIGNVQGENARHVAVRSSGGRQRPARAGALGDGD